MCVLSVAQNAACGCDGRTYIGVGMQEIDGERAKALKLHEEGGSRDYGSGAWIVRREAGLKTGDVLLRYNGQRVEAHGALRPHVARNARRPRGKRSTSAAAVRRKLSRCGSRSGKCRSWNGADSAPLAGSWPFDIHLPDLPRTFMTYAQLGAWAWRRKSIDGQLAQYFGVKEGVLVRSVLKGSAAEKAGIKAGDVIMKIDDAPRRDSGRYNRASYAPCMASPQWFLLMRDHKEVTVTASIGDDDPGQAQSTLRFKVQPQNRINFDRPPAAPRFAEAKIRGIISSTPCEALPARGGDVALTSSPPPQHAQGVDPVVEIQTRRVKARNVHHGGLRR